MLTRAQKRAIRARRAAALPIRPGGATPSTNPALRQITTVTATGHVKRSTAVKMTATQRDSEGNRSAWNDSMDYFTDPKWGRTVSEVRA